MKILILLLHLILLVWIFYSLANSGSLSTMEVFLNFLGMAVYGSLLIVGTATWAKR